jgi:hypothetical protein
MSVDVNSVEVATGLPTHTAKTRDSLDRELRARACKASTGVLAVWV